MDFILKPKAVTINVKKFENNIDQPVEGDITMPDFCPVIKRILKCTASPRLISSRCSGDTANIEVNVQVRVIYMSEDNEIYCFDKIFPISKSIDIGKQTENPVPEVKLKTSYANARAVSERRIDINCSIGINIKIMCMKKEEIVFDAENCGIQLLKNCESIKDFIGETVKNFSLNETVEIGEDKEPVLNILRVNSLVNLSEVKAITNKILIRGEVMLSIIYCSDSKMKKTEKLEHTMPISQIVELEGMSEKTENSVSLTVSGVDISQKSNSAGEKRLLDISAGVSAVVKCFSENNDILSTDCYSTKYDINCEKKQIETESIKDTIDYMIHIKSDEKLSGVKIGEICDLWCENVNIISSVSEGEINFKGNMNLCILGKDDEGVPFYSEKTVDFSDKKKLKDNSSDNCKTEISIKGVSAGFIISKEDELKIKAEISTTVYVINCISEKIVSSIEILKDSLKKSPPAMTVYYSEENENVWDIAKRYNTTSELICSENKISQSDKTHKGIIFIPASY